MCCRTDKILWQAIFGPQALVWRPLSKAMRYSTLGHEVYWPLVTTLKQVENPHYRSPQNLIPVLISAGYSVNIRLHSTCSQESWRRMRGLWYQHNLETESLAYHLACGQLPELSSHMRLCSCVTFRRVKWPLERLFARQNLAKEKGNSIFPFILCHLEH